MSRVKFGDVVKRININVDRFNTDRLYYIGKGATIESDALTVEPHGRINATLGFKFHFGFNPGHILFMSRCFDQHKAATATFAGICSDSTYVVETKDESVLLQRYLQLEMQSDRFWRWCEEHKSGGVNYLINYSTLETYEFDLPSLAEQKVLAEKLWAAYEVKQSYLKMIAATEEMVKAQFIEMFEGDKYPYSSLEDVSDEWLKGQPFKKEEIDEKGTLSCIHYGELFTKYGPIIEHVISKTNATPIRSSKIGDILFPASDVTPNGLTRCSMLSKKDVVLGGDIIILRPKKDYNARYLSCAINQQKSQLLKRVNGAVVKHLSAKGLKTVVIPIPPMDKQDEYVALYNQSDKSISELRKSVDAIDKVIKSLINENL